MRASVPPSYTSLCCLWSGSLITLKDFFHIKSNLFNLLGISNYYFCYCSFNMYLLSTSCILNIVLFGGQGAAEGGTKRLVYNPGLIFNCYVVYLQIRLKPVF